MRTHAVDVDVHSWASLVIHEPPVTWRARRDCENAASPDWQVVGGISKGTYIRSSSWVTTRQVYLHTACQVLKVYRKDLMGFSPGGFTVPSSLEAASLK